jgi:hypothetical protein
MRNAALLLCFVALGYAARSQKFSLLPQVGFENSKTKISYNDGKSFSPLGVRFSPQASLRLTYSSRKGHGFFIGAATSRTIVSYNFADAETGQNNYTATAGDLQVRLEGGYQFNTKPIPLGKSKQTATNTSAKKSCGGSHHCCSRSGNKSQSQSGSRASSWLRIQPSVGMAWVPGIPSDVLSKTQNGQTTYQYNAGNWNTALIAGAGFEFGRGSTRQFTVGINYVKGIGNLDQKEFSSVSSGKLVNTSLSSSVSAWNLRIGIPFSLKAKAKNKPIQQTQHRNSGCSQYRSMYRCTRIN